MAAYGVSDEIYRNAIFAFIEHQTPESVIKSAAEKLHISNRERLLARAHMSEKYGIEITISNEGYFDIYKISEQERFVMFKLEWC